MARLGEASKTMGNSEVGNTGRTRLVCCNQKLLKTDGGLCARGGLAVRVQVHLKSG